ncbi:MAG: hypothetical protein FJY66_00935, partial [Calditrichaeota bacterium]|nr:hypothetical protein [Calditrichota bacterium]
MNHRHLRQNSARPSRNAGRPPGMIPDDEEDLSGEMLSGRWISRVKQAIIGRARNPFDAQIFHKISLIAFFAWVGV